MLISVWLYAYALNVTSSRRFGAAHSRRFGISLFGGGAMPDHWTLNAFRRRHGKGLNDLFTRVVELARASGLGRLGHVAVDSTRIAANASRNRIDTEQALRGARRASGGTFDVGRSNAMRTIPTKARLGGRQPSDGAVGTAGDSRADGAAAQKRLKKLSRTDPDSRFLREREGSRWVTPQPWR